MIDVIEGLPEALGISPVQKHGRNTNFRQLQINKKLDRVKECLKVRFMNKYTVTYIFCYWIACI